MIWVPWIQILCILMQTNTNSLYHRKVGFHIHLYVISSTPHLFSIPPFRTHLACNPSNSIPSKQTVSKYPHLLLLLSIRNKSRSSPTCSGLLTWTRVWNPDPRGIRHTQDAGMLVELHNKPHLLKIQVPRTKSLLEWDGTKFSIKRSLSHYKISVQWLDWYGMAPVG